VQVLPVAKQQVAATEASRALRTLKGFLLGVRALVPVQMLQAGKGALASRADVCSRLVGIFGRRNGHHQDVCVFFGPYNECRSAKEGRSA